MASGLRSACPGSTCLLTGVTGFVGEALLQRLLTEVPGARITVLVRPRGSTGAEERVAALLKKPIFEGCDAGRVGVLEGDIADVPALPEDIDAVVHCAGDVSFNPPVNEAFTTNVVGTRGLLGRIRELGDHVHYVHVSTAYVAGRRRGSIPEGPVDHDVDLEAELAWGLAQGQLVDQRSRDAELLAGFRKEAERSHGRAGLLTAATAVEDRRKEWVKEELIRLGTERARSLGWTDCYTFTKAMGERVVEAHAAHAPVSIVRPSIIESALERPHAGWIEGFKMAEPLILAYGRGELPEFPAAADTDRRHRARSTTWWPRSSRWWPTRRQPGEAGVLPRVLRRPQPADLRRSLRQRARLLRRAPVRRRRPRCGPAAGLAVPRRPVGGAAAVDERARAQGRQLRDRPRPAQ